MNKIDEYIKTTREFLYAKKYEQIEEKLHNLLNEICCFEELIQLMRGNLSTHELNFIVEENNKIKLLNKKGENFLFLLQPHKIIGLKNIPEDMFQKNNTLGQNLLFCDNSLDVFKLLFEKNLNPNQEDKKGYFPIFKLFAKKESNEFKNIVNLFAEKGFDFNKKNKNNLNFLEFIEHKYDKHESVKIVFSLSDLILSKNLIIPEGLINLLMDKFYDMNKYFPVENPLFSYCESQMLKKNIKNDSVFMGNNIKRRI